MPEGCGGRGVYEMLQVYGSLVRAVESLGDGLSLNGPNQFARDKFARHILYTLIPEYKKWVPEGIRSQLPPDINKLERVCKLAMIPNRFDVPLKP